MLAADEKNVLAKSDALQAARHAVRALDGDELRAFNKWYEAYYDDEGWDKQIEMDSAKGRLDADRTAALAASRRGETEPLSDLIADEAGD